MLSATEVTAEAGRVGVSMCEWGGNKPWLWGKDVGHSLRTTGDIYPCFDGKKDPGTTEDVLTAEVPGHDVLMLRLNKM